MAKRYQHVTAPLRDDIAGRLDGFLRPRTSDACTVSPQRHSSAASPALNAPHRFRIPTTLLEHTPKLVRQELWGLLNLGIDPARPNLFHHRAPTQAFTTIITSTPSSSSMKPLGIRKAQRICAKQRISGLLAGR
jgi:hypothetical protein